MTHGEYPSRLFYVACFKGSIFPIYSTEEYAHQLAYVKHVATLPVSNQPL